MSTASARILVDGQAWEVQLDGDCLIAPDSRRFAEATAVYLPPVEPTKIVGIHLNYRSRMAEMAFPQPAAPTYFEKPISALNAHRGAVVTPTGCKYLNYEGEIAIVIGRTARCVATEEAAAYIAGYSVANDFTLHDFVEYDMVRAKGADTLAPIGPVLVPDWDFHEKAIRTYVNGELVQKDTTAAMVWDMHYLVADLSRLMTLVPGDVILSGTPANSRPVSAGDTVTVEVEGIGALTNHIVAVRIPGLEDLGVQPTDSATARAIALVERPEATEAITVS